MQKLQGKALSLGNFMIDIEGTELTSMDVERLMSPKVGGLILFTRNFESIQQIQALIQSVHNLRHPRLLVAVDHEGGRVQRFKHGFTHLPPMRALGEFYQTDPERAVEVAHELGWLLAAELLAIGVDFSFTPVVDLDYGGSKVIGDRAFASNPTTVSVIASSLIKGMRDAGMAAVAKHFPGHGYIEADSHYEMAVDERELVDIEMHDMMPFKGLINQGVDAVMPAHVIYPKVDDKPAGFSKYWLQTQLRKKCHFEGVIISDDLSMQAAKEFGDVTQRVETALDAGCDLVLICNDTQATNQAIREVKWQSNSLAHARLIRMHAHHNFSFKTLLKDPRWQAANHWAIKLNETYRQGSIL